MGMRATRTLLYARARPSSSARPGVAGPRSTSACLTTNAVRRCGRMNHRRWSLSDIRDDLVSAANCIEQQQVPVNSDC